MNLKESINIRSEYNFKLLLILNDLIKKYPELRFGQILYDFGFITKPLSSDDGPFRLFDPFNEEPIITYNRVVKTLNKFEIEL